MSFMSWLSLPCRESVHITRNIVKIFTRLKTFNKVHMHISVLLRHSKANMLRVYSVFCGSNLKVIS